MPKYDIRSQGLMWIVDQWKFDMQGMGYSFGKVSRQADKLREEIKLTIQGALEEGIADFTMQVTNPQDQRFVAELKTDVERALLLTVSGKTDFSIPKYDMKPGLLKNAKHAKDGSLYKVIPVGKPGKDIFQLMGTQSINAQTMLKRRVESIKKVAIKSGSDFKTVTSKQNNDQWIHPGFEANYTFKLEEKNKVIAEYVNQQVVELMNKYEQALEDQWDS